MPENPNQGERKRSSRWEWDAVGAGMICLLAALLLQWSNGAWTSDLGGDPDEAAHAVTSLMVRDYVLDAIPRNPLNYAQEYYEHFPKVALGHYPPGYYAVAAVALLASPQVEALILLQALLCGVAGALVFKLCRSVLGAFGGVMVALVVTVLPSVQKVASCVMSDLLLVVWCLSAGLAWAAYHRTPHAWRAIVFGVFSAAAVLTKGSGLLLAAVPVTAVLLTREFHLIKRASFWLAPLPVLVLAAPWMVFSIRYTKEGMADASGLTYVKQAVPYYAEALWQVMGPLVGVLVAVAFLRVLWNSACGRGVTAEVAVAWGIVLGTLAIAVVVPSGLSTRYLLPVLGPLLLIAMHELGFWTGWILTRGPVKRPASQVAGVRAGVFVVLVAGILWSRGALAPKRVSGFDEAMAMVSSGMGSLPAAQRRCLVSSDARGEGAIIAAAAYGQESRKEWPMTILRGSKEISTSDWLGRGYHASYADPAGLRKRLAELKVGWVLADESLPAQHRERHHSDVVEALTGADGWKLESEVQILRGPDQRGVLKLYRFVGHEGSAGSTKGVSGS